MSQKASRGTHFFVSKKSKFFIRGMGGRQALLLRDLDEGGPQASEVAKCPAMGYPYKDWRKDTLESKETNYISCAH